MSDGFREEMAERVPWLNPVDYDVIEWLSHHDEVDDGFLANPATIAANIDYNNRYIANRCKLLAEAGFLERTSGPKYRITGLGWKLIQSELTAEEAPPEPGDE